MIKLYSITLLMLIIIFPVKKIAGQNMNEMEKLSWIADNWISADGETKSFEHWEKLSDNLFIGGSETVKNGDTIFAEKLRIEKTGSGIYYVADVKHNPEPVKFRLTCLTDTSAVFENPLHDFPQKIIYMLEEGKLHASIEGPGSEGTWRKVEFFMDRRR
jgi:hypothetical protein